MENTKKMPVNKRLLSALLGTVIFTGLMILFDWKTEPELFGSQNYWLKKPLLALPMFILYYFMDKIDLWFKNILGRKKNNK